MNEIDRKREEWDRADDQGGYCRGRSVGQLIKEIESLSGTDSPADHFRAKIKRELNRPRQPAQPRLPYLMQRAKGLRPNITG